jgi:hypothetical protein
LSTEEIKIVREYVYRSNNRPILGENKIEKLFDILVKDPEKKFTDKELSDILESNAGALRVLKSRLFEKAKEAMIFDKHFENPLVFNDREQIVFTLKKQILFIKSLFRTLNQGRAETINVLLAETIKIAKKYEVYDVLIESLIQQKHIKGVRVGFEEFVRINNQVKFYENCFKCIQDACDAFYTLIPNQNLANSLTKKELENHIKISIKKMETDYKITNAQEVNYYLHIFKIALCENEKDFTQAIVYCKKLLTLIKKNIVLHSRDRVGFAMSNLCMFSVFSGKFNEAVIYAKNAQKFHINNSFNHPTLKEQEFYAKWYGGNYVDALTCTEENVEAFNGRCKGLS